MRRIASGAPNYQAINAAAIRVFPEILSRWLPGGKQIVGNPKRGDRGPGSFCINTHIGKWADFATGDAGGDVIALAAWLFGLSPLEAARRVAAMVGMSTDGAANG